MSQPRKLKPYRLSLAGTILQARESVMAPIRPILRASRLTEQQWRVLRVLMDEGPVDPSRLAHSAVLHAPSVTRILRQLVGRRLVARSADHGDARRSIIAISARGESLVMATAAHTLSVLDQYVASFGSERLEHLIRELQALSAAINEQSFVNVQTS